MAVWSCAVPYDGFHEATGVYSARSAAHCTLIMERLRAQSLQKLCHAQGVPVDFLTRNEQFVSASAQHMPGQVQPDSLHPPLRVSFMPSHAEGDRCII